MLASLFPASLPGIKLNWTRTPAYRTSVFRNPGGARLTVGWRATPLYRFTCYAEVLQDSLSERSGLESLFASALGGLNAFILVDPFDSVPRRVNFAKDELSVTRIVGGLYESQIALEADGTISSIAVTPANPSKAHPGTQQFVATATFSDTSTLVITSIVTWLSASTNRATIDAAGLATTVSAGTSVISATLGTISGNTTLTVT